MGTAAAAALAGVGPKLALAAEGIQTEGGDPDVVVPAAAVAPNRVIDGFSKVLQNRWNQDLPPVAKVGQGEAVQFLCRDALDIGVAARTLTPGGVLTLDLGKVHPLTGPVEVAGAQATSSRWRFSMSHRWSTSAM